MKTLLMKHSRSELDGNRRRELAIRERRAFRSEPSQDTYIKKTQDIWLLGPPQSGKSSAIDRLMKHSASVWAKWPTLPIRAHDPLSRWLDQEALQTWVSPEGKSYATLGLERKLEVFLQWCQQRPCVWIIDDAHALSARKLDVLLRLLQNARVIVIGALSEQSLHPSLRTFLQRRGPQVLSLSSEAPYDATLSIMWLLLLIAIGAGWWELAAALSAVRGLGRGPLATRQR